MTIANDILQIIDEANSAKEAKKRYMSLPGVRIPFTPFDRSEWNALAEKLTRKYFKKYGKMAINFGEFHFEAERAGKMGAQLPAVERMMDLALSTKKMRRSVIQIMDTYTSMEKKYAKTYDAPGAKRVKDFADRGGLNVFSKSLRVWLIGEIVGRIPVFAPDDTRFTWMVKTFSNKSDFFKTRPGDITIEVESFEGDKGPEGITIEVE